MLQQTFYQKVLIAMFAGLCAACLLWVFRHIVERAFYESSDAGNKALYEKHSRPTPPRR